MAVSDCNADTLANQLYVSLTADAPTPPTVDFTDPKFDFELDETSTLYQDVVGVTLEELTEVDLKGEGVYDKLMCAVDLHIQREFKGNRLTGDQYAKVYTEVMIAVLGQSTSFLLQKDQARWAAVKAQMDARIAEIQATQALVELEKAKAETAKMVFDMQNSGAEYALTKMKIANADAEHCMITATTSTEEYKRNYSLPAELAIQQYQRMEVLPSTVAINKVQHERILPAEAAIKEFTNREIQTVERDIQVYNRDVVLPLKKDQEQYNLDNLYPVNLGIEQHKLNFQMPAQTNLLNEQKESQRAQTLDNRSDALTPITGLLGRQRSLIEEQYESERAKTLDTRSDDSTIVVGSVGKQKDLYSEQITSFIKDAKHKTAKMYLDGWITQKTLDEGLLAPTELQNTTVDTVLSSIRLTNDLI